MPVRLSRALPFLLAFAILFTPVPDTHAQDTLLPEAFQFAPEVPRDASIPSPSDFLGRETGESYTLHADVVRYIHAVADASDRVTIEEYGRTYEGRPLYVLTVTSPDNHGRLDQIQADNVELADPATSADRAAEIMSGNPIVTWLSYNVHGNEPSSTESAMEVLYLLAAGQSEHVTDLLEESVVLIDPVINPDGRDRYVYWYKSMRSRQLRVDAADLEHTEPWPGGRTNHYWFDLNRDWVWLVHPESQGRIKVYQDWMPQVHMDYHEQGFNNNYFTMPGKAPRNLNLPEEYESWADMFGRASGEALARNQVNYFTRESFEFFYPGYGSSYPSIMGAIGMLAEQGGHSRGGRAVETNDGYVLTLRQRAWDHFATSMAVVESSVEHREDLLSYYRAFFDPSMSDNPTTAYLIPDDGGNGYVTDVINLLLDHGIEVEQASDSFTIEASDYWSASAARHTFEAGTWIVPTDQARHVMVNTLMQRQMEIESRDMYDMSTWSIPLAYNLQGAAWTEQRVGVSTQTVTEGPQRESGVTNPDARYGFVIDWRQRHAPKALGMLWTAGYDVRAARRTFGIGETDYPVGSIIVLKGRNRDKMESMSADMQRIAREAGVRIEGYDVSRVDRGMDLASADARVIDEPRVVLMLDSPFSSETAGQIWYLFDQRVQWGIDRVRGDNFSSLDLDEVDVLVFPPGNVGSMLDSTQTARVSRWIRQGGTLIGSESAASYLAGSRSGLSSAEMVRIEKDEEGEPDVDERVYTRYEDRSDSTNVSRVSGSAFRAVLDNSHPMAAGMPETMYTLKFGTDAIEPSRSIHSVGYYDRDAANLLASGFASEENQEKMAGNLFAGVQQVGSGKVIFLLDKTQYRMFWLGPTRLLVNSIMLMHGM
jgi:hypothetical protein